jgi:hypothetical protein
VQADLRVLSADHNSGNEIYRRPFHNPSESRRQMGQQILDEFLAHLHILQQLGVQSKYIPGEI